MKNVIFRWVSHTVVLCLLSLNLSAQNVGINATGANPHSSAGLDVNFANKGFLPPRVVDTNAILSPVEGLQIYDNSCHCLRIRTNVSWTTGIGPAGANGKNTLAKTSVEAAGINCPTGGTKLEYGLDANSNNVLDAAEVNSSLTKYVCNGANGAIGLTGANGASGKNTLAKTTAEAAGLNCSAGGIKLEYGLDANSNDILEASEINPSLTKYVCNGSTGAVGAAGVAGTNGKNTLVKTSTEAAGVNCPTGGTKLEYGLDANSNNILDASEIISSLTKYVCNGVIGGSNTQVIYNNNGVATGSSNLTWDNTAQALTASKVYATNLKTGTHAGLVGPEPLFGLLSSSVNSITGNANAIQQSGISGTGSSTTNALGKTFVISAAPAGYIVKNVRVTVKLNSNCIGDSRIYLKSPSGRILNVKGYEDGGGGCNSAVPGAQNGPGQMHYFYATFRDDATLTLNQSNGGYVSPTGTYPATPVNIKPSGESGPMSVSWYSPGVTPNIYSFADFYGDTPNGTWTLYIEDHDGATVPGDPTTFNMGSVVIEYGPPVSYEMIGQANITYVAGNKIITNTSFAGNSDTQYGVITAVTRTTTPLTISTTPVSTLPGTIVSYAVDQPNGTSGSGVSTTNVSIDATGLTDGQTYYYQLWVGGGASKESYTILPVIMP